VHFTRLVIEDGDQLSSLELHPRLTVLSGVDAAARAGLVAELIGALGASRRGVNLELCEDGGRRVAVLRPSGGAHRVIDLAQRCDVTDEFRGADGRLDLLGRYGLDIRRAEQLLHLDGSGLHADIERDDAVLRLAAIDQTTLWSAAARVRVTDDELATFDANQTVEPDEDMVARVEQRHQWVENASTHRRIQRDATLVCGVSLIAATVVTFVAPMLALPLLVVAVATAVGTLLLRGRSLAAERSEQVALTAAGADSYLSFVVGRVDDLMQTTTAHRRRLALADDHRTAAVRWTQVAGDVSVAWALEHHAQIDAAARLRRELAALGALSSTAPTLDEETTALAQALVAHLAKLRTLGTGAESLPLILDDPFTEVDPAVRLTLVELLARSAGEPQVVLLTSEEQIASWARLEALTGDVALVEPELLAGPTQHARNLAV
jgi:hypothetical protein